MALNNSKPLIFISSLGPRVDEADDDDEQAQGGRNVGCGCVGKMTLESSGNFGYFVWLLGQTERALRGRGGATATVQNAAMFNLRQTNEQTRRIVKLREGLDLPRRPRWQPTSHETEAEPLTTPSAPSTPLSNRTSSINS